MRLDRIILGLAVATGGILWLLVNLGLVPHDAVREVMPYWPILLIVWGLLVYMGKGGSSAQVLLIVLVLMLVGLFLFAFASPYHRNMPEWRQRIGADPLQLSLCAEPSRTNSCSSKNILEACLTDILWSAQ